MDPVPVTMDVNFYVSSSAKTSFNHLVTPMNNCKNIKEYVQEEPQP